MPSLNPDASRKGIVSAVRQHRVVVLVGETGSGKTTQVPRFLYEAAVNGRSENQRTIAITQPRRIAAISVANHVASEMGCQIGGGDGLSRYIVSQCGCQRSIDTDVLLGLVKLSMMRLPGALLEVVVMSATIHAAPFVNFFGGPEKVHLLQVPGRQHAVQLYYTPSPEPDVLEAAMLAVLQLHVTRPLGDILVFLPGQEEIDGLQRLLEEKQEILAKQRQDHPEKGVLERTGRWPAGCCQFARLANIRERQPTRLSRRMQDGHSFVQRMISCQVPNMVIRPIYAALPFEQQAFQTTPRALVFEATPPGYRKVVLATNIAETSITIPGIRFVVDTGIMKLKMCHPQTGIDMLRTVETSQASAIQRAGRAGREAPGEVFRLYVESDYQKMPVQTPAEILRLEMASVYINLKALGISKIASFPLVDRPPREAIEKAAHFLCRIGALDTRDAGIVAMLSADAPIFTTSGKRGSAQQAKPYQHQDGDHLSLLSAFRNWRKQKKPKAYAAENGLSHSALEKAENIRKQLKERPKNWAVVRRCLLKGLFLQTAQRDEVNQNLYRTLLSRQEAKLHPSSVLHRRQPPPSPGPVKMLLSCVVYSDLVVTSKTYLRTVTEAALIS
ncbi:unnamed protein product [Symbiodinium sp. CCMP2456]|nr:unnamed protein product [Symbiodinium sp. CCMP2456]